MATTQSIKCPQMQQIRTFLTAAVGEEQGNLLAHQAETNLSAILAATQGKTKNQMKTLTQTILPRIALYKALQASGRTEEEITSLMRHYMLDVVAAKKHASTAKMERVPGFYRLYSSIFLKIMKTTDLQQSTQHREKDSYDITITQCLWHTACVENGCEELCRLFCDVDDVTYGGLRKIGFSRTQTLGYGGKCCDFHFYRK